MDVNETKLHQEVTVTMLDGKTVDGIVKGINEDCQGKITIKVEYLTPVQREFELDKVSLK